MDKRVIDEYIDKCHRDFPKLVKPPEPEARSFWDPDTVICVSCVFGIIVLLILLIIRG